MLILMEISKQYKKYDCIMKYLDHIGIPSVTYLTQCRTVLLENK